MYNSEIKKPALPFTVSSVFFIIITMVKLFSNYVLPEMLGERFYVSAEATVYMVVTFILAIFLIIKRLFLVNTILIGILTAFETYWLLSDLSYGNSTITYTFTAVLGVVSWILLLVISIGAVTKNSFKGIGRVWFIPMLLQFITLPVNIFEHFRIIVMYVEDIDYYEGALFWFIRMIFVLVLNVLFVIALALLCKWYGRVIGDQREALENAYSYAQPVYTEPVYAQPTYEQPVYSEPLQEQPVHTEKISPAETDLAAELEKYKNLYEQGLITQTEYDAKKAQLLNL